MPALFAHHTHNNQQSHEQQQHSYADTHTHQPTKLTFLQQWKENLLNRENDPVKIGINPIINGTDATGMGGNYGYTVIQTVTINGIGGNYHTDGTGIGADYSKSTVAGGRTRPYWSAWGGSQ